MRDEHEKSSFSPLWSDPTLIIIIAMKKEMNGNEFNLVRFVRFANSPEFLSSSQLRNFTAETSNLDAQRPYAPRAKVFTFCRHSRHSE